jgi:hypothetical protein
VNASHLDDLKLSDKVRDISSFQDIELYPLNNPRPKDDENRSTCASTVEGNDHRLAKEHYYLLPYVRKYKVWILGCALEMFLLFLAIGLSASVKRNKQRRDNDGDGGGDGSRG